jgi:hypothetical protein
MIRSALASPWLPLAYWTAIFCAALCALPQYLSKGHTQRSSIAKVSDVVTAQVNRVSQVVQSLPGENSITRHRESVHVWVPAVLCLRGFDRKPVAAEVEPRKVPIVAEALQSPTPAPVTMLSIRADSAEEPTANVLSIECRTSLAVSNMHGRAVSIHGVVTQEVVSPAGKILIMAGSRVAGSGLFDPESGRLRSNRVWTIVFENTEMKVRALLLDRPGGLLGVIGQVKQGESVLATASADSEGGRLELVPANTPFTLELHGEIQLRDLASNESEY